MKGDNFSENTEDKIYDIKKIYWDADGNLRHGSSEPKFINTMYKAISFVFRQEIRSVIETTNLSSYFKLILMTKLTSKKSGKPEFRNRCCQWN